MAAIIFIALIIINWIIYHKIFDVIYFKLGAGLFKEFAICFFIAGIEMAILAKIGSFLLRIILVLVIVIGVPLGIKNSVDDMKKFKKFLENMKASTKDTGKAETDSPNNETIENE